MCDEPFQIIRRSIRDPTKGRCDTKTIGNESGENIDEAVVNWKEDRSLVELASREVACMLRESPPRRPRARSLPAWIL